MKTVFYQNVCSYINGILIYSSGLSYNLWHYGEMPQDEKLKYTDFDEVYDYNVPRQNYWTDVSVFRKKKLICFDDGTAFTKTISKNKFESYEIEYEYRPVSYTYTIEDLVKRLPAEDFIEYCKDNGIGDKGFTSK